MRTRSLATLLSLAALSQACSASTPATEQSEDALVADAVSCEPTPTPGIRTRVFRSATNDSVFYFVPEQWHVTGIGSHELFVHENASGPSAVAAAEMSPFFGKMFIDYRLRWTAFESTDEIEAALLAATGLPSVSLRELTSVAPPSVQATFTQDDELISAKVSYPGGNAVVTTLSSNVPGLNGDEVNNLRAATENRSGLLSLQRRFAYRCVDQEGALPRVRPLGLVAGVMGNDGAANTIQYDTTGLDLWNDVDIPLLAVGALNHVDDVTKNLTSQPPVQSWRPVYDAYLAAGWEAWRVRAVRQLTLDATHAERWGAGSIATQEVRATAATLRDDLLQLVADVAAAEGSPLAPREFLKRKWPTGVDFLIEAGLLDSLERLATFQRTHWVRSWYR